MKKDARPSALKILGREYKVSYRPDFHLSGECNRENNSITVLDGQPGIEEADTIVHEVLHAVWWLMDIGLSNQEEHVVRKLATGLTLVLKDNPQLLAYLSGPKVCALLKPPRRKIENSTN